MFVSGAYLVIGLIWYGVTHFCNKLIIKKGITGYKMFLLKALPFVSAVVIGNVFLNGISGNVSFLAEVFLILFAISFLLLLLSPFYLLSRLFKKKKK